MLLALSRKTDPKALELLRRHPEIDVALNAPQSALITEEELVPVEVRVLDADQIEPLFDRLSPSKALLALVNAVLDDETAARLEDAGISYLDAAGKRWLRGHERTKRSTSAAAPSRRSLYAASIKLAQLLADHPDEPWSERGLANCAHTTQATAHRLLARLEKEGLVIQQGRGRSTVRWVRDALELRRWLAREARPTRVTLLSCFVANPFELPQLVGRNFALTGAAAAERLGFPVLTGEHHPLVRVNVAHDELEDIPEALGGFRTESGANLTLIADPDRLAFVDVDRPVVKGGSIASPSRIMLDLYLEPRGEAAVEVFLDLWGQRELV